MLSRNREIKNLYCYLLTWIESKSNRKLLSGNEKYRDVPYGPPEENGKKSYETCLSIIQEEKNGKSKFDIDFQFLILN